MALGSIAAAIHGAALPLYLYVLGRIINLFGSYQQDVNANPGISLSSSLLHSLAEDILEVNYCLPFLFTLMYVVYIRYHLEMFKGKYRACCLGSDS